MVRKKDKFKPYHSKQPIENLFALHQTILFRIKVPYLFWNIYKTVNIELENHKVSLSFYNQKLERNPGT